MNRYVSIFLLVLLIIISIVIQGFLRRSSREHFNNSDNSNRAQANDNPNASFNTDNNNTVTNSATTSSNNTTTVTAANETVSQVAQTDTTQVQSSQAEVAQADTVQATQPAPVDCVMSEWSSWTDCSKTCGGGTKTRTRKIETPSANGGVACSSTFEEQACNTQACATDCKMSEWTPWTECTKPCGGGKQQRTRSVETPAANGGAECPSAMEEQACNTQACPIDCVMSPWESWSVCSKLCGGGKQTRNRKIQIPSAYGGSVCPSLFEEQQCNTQACPIDCVVSDWSEWSSCSKQCDGGKQSRTRTIKMNPSNGGAVCPSLKEEQECNKQSCEYSTYYKNATKLLSSSF